MISASDKAMRWRVRFGYVLVFFVAWLAHPTPVSILVGVLIALPGLFLRGAAAGHLRKHEALATSGPYAYTRNPLYLGSALLALGMVVAAKSWILALLIAGYFAYFYSLVMRREERELRERYGAAFEEYAARVPLFLAKFSAAARAEAGGSVKFSWAQYGQNREWQATAGALLVILFLWLKMELL
jgi:protein-S-isoprenylcysteine O-methyltransferase Ste14